MRKLFYIIRKNLHVLLKSKFSLFILLLGPILIISLMGFFYYNNNLYNINLGVYVPDDNEFSELFLQELKGGEFRVVEFESSEECLGSIKDGFIHACIFFPKNFSISENKTNEIVVSLDTSRGDVVSVTQNLLLDELAVRSESIQILNTQKLIDVLDSNQRRAVEIQNKVNDINTINYNLADNGRKIENVVVQIDFLYRPEKFQVDQLISRALIVNSSIANFEESSEGLITETLIYLDNVSEVLKQLNGTNDGVSDQISELTNDAYSNINTVGRKIRSLGDSYSLRKLSSDIDEMKENLDEIKYGLDNLTNQIELIVNSSILLSSELNSELNILNDEAIYLESEVDNIAIFDAKSIVRPVSVKLDNVVTNSEVHLTSLFPSLLVSLVFIISLILASTFVLMERKSMAFFRNFMTKTSEFSFLLGDFLTLFLIVFLQIGLIIFIYYGLFIKYFDIQVFYLVLYLIPMISVFVLIGMFIGYITNNEASNVIFTFVIIFIIFSLSGALVPIEALSEFLMSVAYYNPYVLAEGTIRKFLLFEMSFTELRSNVLILGIYFVVLFCINLILESISKKRFIYNLFIFFERKIKSISFRSVKLSLKKKEKE